MQVTLDIPEARYREFEERAVRQHRPVADVVLSEVLRSETGEEFRQRMKDRYPLIKSDRPGSMKIPEDGFNDFMFATDDELT